MVCDYLEKVFITIVFLNKKMANKDFTKDVVPRSIVSYRKCQYSSDSGNIRK